MNTYTYLSIYSEAISRTAVLIFGFMTLFFIYALYKKRNDIADIAWGIGFIIVAWANFYMYGFWSSTFIPGAHGPFRMQVLLVVLAVTLWGIRLATHIALRNAGKEEDFRYKKWREDWNARYGKLSFIRMYLQIFLLQGLLMLLISLPVIAVSIFGITTISFVTIVGFLIWLTGFVFESGGDRQLSLFIKNPENKGKIMSRGFWSLTRHPNYFGEVTQWWGIYLMALPTFISTLTVSFNVWVIALIGPLTISFLILKVSGIPMLEKKYEGNTDFEEYKKRTNAFFPWFPKNQ